MTGNHEKCEQQIDQLSHNVRTLLLNLNDVIVNKVKPMQAKIEKLESDLGVFKDELRNLKSKETRIHEEIVKTSARAEQEGIETLTKEFEGKISLLENKIKALENRSFDQSSMEKNLTMYEGINAAAPVTKEQFYCTYCNRRLKSEHGLWRHMETSHPHLEPLLFKCNYCERTFSNRDFVWSHTVEAHIEFIEPFH